jgi:hypothetical protein
MPRGLRAAGASVRRVLMPVSRRRAGGPLFRDVGRQLPPCRGALPGLAPGAARAQRPQVGGPPRPRWLPGRGRAQVWHPGPTPSQRPTAPKMDRYATASLPPLLMFYSAPNPTPSLRRGKRARRAGARWPAGVPPAPLWVRRACARPPSQQHCPAPPIDRARAPPARWRSARGTHVAFALALPALAGRRGLAAAHPRPGARTARRAPLLPPPLRDFNFSFAPHAAGPPALLARLERRLRGAPRPSVRVCSGRPSSALAGPRRSRQLSASARPTARAVPRPAGPEAAGRPSLCPSARPSSLPLTHASAEPPPTPPMPHPAPPGAGCAPATHPCPRFPAPAPRAPPF